MRINSTLLLFLLCGFLVTGCSNIEKFSDDTPQVVAAPDAVTAMLANAADRASNALETLAAVEHARTPNAEMAPVGSVPTELKRAITVNWIGPVEPVAQSLANRASYEFLTIGAAPSTPIIVSLDVENRPVIDVLRDIGLQLGIRGDIKVDSNRRMIEIHYAPNTGVGS